MNSEPIVRDEDVIWRYVPLRRLLDYLSGQVFLPSVAKLRSVDPFEGEFFPDTPWFNTAMAHRYKNEREAVERWIHNSCCTKEERSYIDRNARITDVGSEIYLRHYADFICRTRFVWCWFRSAHESALMWSTYGNQGAAIQSTVGHVKAALSSGGCASILCKPMTYVPCGMRSELVAKGDPRHPLLLQPYFLKRKEYEAENEVRFVTSAPPNQQNSGIFLQGIAPEQWIKRVSLWHGLTHDEAGCIRGVIERLAPGLTSDRSDLFTGAGGAADTLRAWRESIDQETARGWKDGSDQIPKCVKEI